MSALPQGQATDEVDVIEQILSYQYTLYTLKHYFFFDKLKYLELLITYLVPVYAACGYTLSQGLPFPNMGST